MKRINKFALKYCNFLEIFLFFCCWTKKIYFPSIDSQAASSSLAHLSSSKLIKFAAGTGAGAAAGVDFDFELDDFFEFVVRFELFVGLARGSSFNHDSKLASRSCSDTLSFDFDC